MAEMSARLKSRDLENRSEGHLSHVTCSRCGGSVYEYMAPTRGFGKMVSRVSGCTTYGCYRCGRRGWSRNGRSHLGVAILARTIQGVIILAVALAAAIAVFGVFMR